jgi:hypothetical protein
LFSINIIIIIIIARITATFVLLICATVDGVRRRTAYKADYSFCEASSLQLAAAGARREEGKEEERERRRVNCTHRLGWP